ncbi:unnamed protein product, partial [Closterium sp. Naga37s-1]
VSKAAKGGEAPSPPSNASMPPSGDGDGEWGVPGSGGLSHLAGPHGLHCSPPRLHLPHAHPRPAAALRPSRPAYALPEGDRRRGGQGEGARGGQGGQQGPFLHLVLRRPPHRCCHRQRPRCCLL